MSKNKTAADANEALPWSDPPALARKPPGLEYGYISLERGSREPVLHQCRLDELEEKVASGEALEVIVPEFDRLAPPSIVEPLWPAVKTRERGRRIKERQNAFFNLCLFGGISLYSVKSGDSASAIVILMFVLFGLVPMIQYLIGAVRRKLHGEGTFEEMRARTLFAYWLGAGATPATVWSVRILIGVFIAQVLASAFASGSFTNGLFHYLFLVGQESIDAGALVKPQVRDGEVWRLITCGLLHGGLLHIGFNGMAFANVGAVLERFYGWAILLATFFLSVLGGSLASQILMPDKTSLGASGGIMGLVGFLLVVGVRHRGAFPADFAKSIIRSVLFMAALGFLAKDYIDNAAHGGGFLIGCLIALPLSGNVRDLGRFPDSGLIRRLGWGSALVLGVAALWVLFRLVAAAGLIPTGAG